MPYTSAIIYGSVRSQRNGIYAANYIKSKIEARQHHVHFIDPLVYNLPLLDKMYKEYEPGKAPAKMEELAAKFNDSDGFVIVTGEYNHSVPPALKNLLDHFQKAYFFKPSAIASYSAGRFGGVRCAVHMRAIVGELGMSSIPSILPIPKVHKAFDEQNNPVETYTEKATDKFLDEYEWYLEALKNQREKGLPY